jgi:2-haloacid dehalogenase
MVKVPGVSINTMKRTIVFDIGGVLIDWDPRYLYSKIFSDQDEMEFFLRAVCSPEWNVQMDGEKSFSDSINELIPHHPEYADQIRAYFNRWEEMIAGEIPETVKVLLPGIVLGQLKSWQNSRMPLTRWQHSATGPLKLSR